MQFNRPQEQLSLDLPVSAASARDDLIVTPANQQAVEFLDSWPQWPGPIAILAGPIGSGKTHLAKVWATRSGARFVTPDLTGEQDIPAGGNLVVEDLRQGSFSETWLFHLINSVRASSASLLLTSRRWPGDWGLALPDLKSRMKLAHLMELYEPDEIMLNGVLQKLFSDRQIEVDPAIVQYIVQRMERSLASAQIVVDEVDRLSLQQKRKVTKPLVADALHNLDLSV